MHKAKIDLREGIDKNGKNWYGVVITIADFETELSFIDRIHYMYLKNLNNQVAKTSADQVAKH